MPYIPQEQRTIINQKMSDLLATAGDLTDGQLNYIISNLIYTHLQKTNINYSKLNSMIGVLDCAKLELYNRLITPYETQKITENGKLYNTF